MPIKDDRKHLRVHPEIGIRLWRVIDEYGEPRLHSVGKKISDHGYWTPRQPFIASCSKCEDLENWHKCSCGIYAWKPDTGEAYETYERIKQGPYVLGEVKLWVDVIEATQGYRAQAAYPKSFHLPENYSSKEYQRYVRLAKAYGAELKDYPSSPPARVLIKQSRRAKAWNQVIESSKTIGAFIIAVAAIMALVPLQGKPVNVIASGTIIVALAACSLIYLLTKTHLFTVGLALVLCFSAVAGYLDARDNDKFKKLESAWQASDPGEGEVVKTFKASKDISADEYYDFFTLELDSFSKTEVQSNAGKCLTTNYGEVCQKKDVVTLKRWSGTKTVENGIMTWIPGA